MKSWYRNAEGYYSPTEGQAIDNLMREDREKRRQAEFEKRKLEKQKRDAQKKLQAQEQKEASRKKLEQLDKDGKWKLAYTYNGIRKAVTNDFNSASAGTK